MTRRRVALLAVLLAAALAPARPASAHHFANFEWSATASPGGYSGTAVGLFHDPGTCAISWQVSGSTGVMHCNGTLLPTGMSFSISCAVTFGSGTISGTCTGTVSGTLTGVGDASGGSAVI